jgi:hypothetical protein
MEDGYGNVKLGHTSGSEELEDETVARRCGSGKAQSIYPGRQPSMIAYDRPEGVRILKQGTPVRNL